MDLSQSYFLQNRRVQDRFGFGPPPTPSPFLYPKHKNPQIFVALNANSLEMEELFLFIDILNSVRLFVDTK